MKYFLSRDRAALFRHSARRMVDYTRFHEVGGSTNVQPRKKASKQAAQREARAIGVYLTTVIFINRRCFASYYISIDSPVARVRRIEEVWGGESASVATLGHWLTVALHR